MSAASTFPILFALVNAAGKSAVLLAVTVLFAGALLLPILSIVLPAWRTPWLPGWSAVSVEAKALPEASPSPPILLAAPSTTNSYHSASLTIASALPPTDSHATLPPASSADLVPISRWSWILPIWSAGTILALLPLAIGAWQMRRLTRRCAPVTDPAWTQLLARVAADLRLRRRVRLRLGPSVNAPLTWGAWRPVLVLPEEAAAWPIERRRVVLLHELAHITRWDWLTQTLACLACALYWFNPLAWFAAHRMRIERERACDDLVLRHGSRPSDYADELLRLATRLGSRGLINWAAVPMARHSTLEGRLLAILDARRNRSALTRAAVLAALALVAAIVVPIAMLKAAPENSSPGIDSSTPNTSANSYSVSSAPASSTPATPSALTAKCWVLNVPADFKFDPAHFDPDKLSQTQDIEITAVPPFAIRINKQNEFTLNNPLRQLHPASDPILGCQFFIHAEWVDVVHAGQQLMYSISYTTSYSLPGTPTAATFQIGGIADGCVPSNQPFLCDLKGDHANPDPQPGRKDLAVFIFQSNASSLASATAVARETNLVGAPPANSPPDLSITGNLPSDESIRIFPLSSDLLATIIGPLPSSDGQISSALEAALTANGVDFGPDAGVFYDTRTNQIVVKNTAPNLHRIAGILEILRVQNPELNLETRDFPMSQATLARLTGRHSSEPGKIDPHVTDDLMNFFVNAGVAFPEQARLAYDGTKIWVTNTPQNLDRLANLLQRYSEIKQVEVDAKFLEVQLGQLQQLGFKWNVTGANGTASSGNLTGNSTAPGQPPAASNGTATGNLRLLGNAFPSASSNAQTTTITQGTIDPVTGLLVVGNTTSTPQTIPSLPGGINVGAGATSAFGGTLGVLNGRVVTGNTSNLGGTLGVLNGYSVNTIISALEQTHGATVLSAPKVTVLSEKEAELSVTQDGVKSPNGLYATDPMGITFTVLPVVEDDDSISYSIKARLSDVVSQQSETNGTVQHFEVTELVTSGNTFDGETVVFDLGDIDHPTVFRDSVPGSSKIVETPGTLHFHRYALVTFNLIVGNNVNRLPPGALFQQPTQVSPTPQVRRTPAPANPSS
ncbi:MAG: M56 family metallopeptidase [Opitutales bacterium]